MPTDHILSLLIAERDKLNGAIAALRGSTKRLVRPAKTAMAVTEPSAAAHIPASKKRSFTPAQRKQQAARMKAYWAAKKKAAK